MSLKFDMIYGVGQARDNFHCQLIRLMQKADRHNYSRLKLAFPNTAQVLEEWAAGEEVSDLPYEGQE